MDDGIAYISECRFEHRRRCWSAVCPVLCIWKATVGEIASCQLRQGGYCCVMILVVAAGAARRQTLCLGVLPRPGRATAADAALRLPPVCRWLPRRMPPASFHMRYNLLPMPALITACLPSQPSAEPVSMVDMHLCSDMNLFHCDGVCFKHAGAPGSAPAGGLTLRRARRPSRRCESGAHLRCPARTLMSTTWWQAPELTLGMDNRRAGSTTHDDCRLLR